MKDLKGRPIRVGDLVRTYHFRDRRWGHQWLYHVVCDVGEKLYECRPVEELAIPYDKHNGGRYWLTEEMASQMEIIHGGGGYPDNIYQERK
jgi:hypothetical protein